MNVYQLADALEKIETYNQVIHRSFNDKTKLMASADMLRQQADRIAELESCLDFALQDTMDYITLNNLDGENNHWLVWARKLLVNKTPQTKPLSDEEIDKIIYSVDWAYDPVLLARAIEERHGIK